MAAFPKWNGLKHFNAVSTIKFTDGQSFYDILKASCFFCYFSNHYKKPNTLLNSAFFLALLIYSPKIQLWSIAFEHTNAIEFSLAYIA